MLPELVEKPGSVWSALPRGIHWATLDEVKRAFVTNEHRKWLFEDFIKVADHLAQAGCKRLYLDGSFVTGKPRPGDYDLCWDADGVRIESLDPVLLKPKSAIRKKYLGDIVTLIHPDGGTFLEFFQTDREGNPKGIVGIRLAGVEQRI